MAEREAFTVQSIAGQTVSGVEAGGRPVRLHPHPLRRRGGNASNRSSERHEREIAYLRRKWGRWLDVVQAKGTTRLVLRVQR